MDFPETRYAKSGDLHITYQATGSARSTWCSYPVSFRTSI